MKLCFDLKEDLNQILDYLYETEIEDYKYMCFEEETCENMSDQEAFKRALKSDTHIMGCIARLTQALEDSERRNG